MNGLPSGLELLRHALARRIFLGSLRREVSTYEPRMRARSLRLSLPPNYSVVALALQPRVKRPLES